MACFIVAILLPIGTISANDNHTDSHVSIPIDGASDIPCSISNVELSKSFESDDCNIDLNVSANSKVAMSSKESLESENILSANPINNASNISENETDSVNSSVNSNSTVVSKIPVSSTIKSKDVTKYYKGKTLYTAKFLNIQNHPLANKKVSIKVKGKSYTIKTDSKGLASLAINFKPGTYKVTAKNPDTGYRVTNTFKILSTIDTKNLVKFYKDSRKFSAKFLKSNGKVLSKKIIKFKIGKRVYKVKTNKKGIARLSLNNLNKGTYKIKSYNIDGLTKTNTIKILIPTKKIPVLVFHKIVPDKVKKAKYPNDEWVASESVFAAMMKYIHDHKYNVISIEEFNKWYDGKIECPKKTIVITIDDGYLTDYAIAYPILKKYNFKFTSFIVGSEVPEKTINCKYTKIKDYEKYPYARMGKDIIDKMHDEYPNWSFQGHSYNLHYIKKGTVAINLKTSLELKKDFEKLSKMFKFNILAYPYGVHNDNAKKILKKTGYKMAFRFGPPKYATRDDDRYAISRVKINSYMNVKDLAKWLKV